MTIDKGTYISTKLEETVRPNDGFDIKLGAFDVSNGDSASFRYDDFSCDVTFD